MGRMDKPFNPFLGETFELITPTFKFLAECVSHHPTVIALHVQGEGFDVNINTNAAIAFTGREVHVSDSGYSQFKISHPNKEEPDVYDVTAPQFVIGNLFMGEKFAEPQGKSSVTNAKSGEYAEMEYYRRAMFGNK